MTRSIVTRNAASGAFAIAVTTKAFAIGALPACDERRRRDSDAILHQSDGRDARAAPAPREIERSAAPIPASA
jgi:hypothetical protein